MILCLTLPIKTVSESNRRDAPRCVTARSGKKRWMAGYIVKALRAKQQRRDTYLLLRSARASVDIRTESRVLCELTRVATRMLDCDNLRSAIKGTRDGVADYLKVDDGSDQIVWSYSQEIVRGKNEIRLRITVND